MRSEPRKPIQPDRVLLFLVAEEGGGFAPLLLIDGAARGVLWFCGDEVYGYRQCTNPGPYELGRWEEAAADAGPPAMRTARRWLRELTPAGR